MTSFFRDPTVITSFTAIAVAVVTGLLTVISGRKKARADVQTVLNAGFQSLVNDLQEERNELMSIIRNQSATIERLEAELRRKPR